MSISSSVRAWRCIGWFVFALWFLCLLPFHSLASPAAGILMLTPPNPRDYEGPAPDGGVGGERGAYFTALNTFAISGVGIEADLTSPSLTLIANIYAANGLQRGTLLASNSRTFNDEGTRFYDVPISFTFTNGGEYDIAIDFSPEVTLAVRFFNFDPEEFNDPPFEAGGLVRVRDGEYLSQADNYVLPHLRLFVGGLTNRTVITTTNAWDGTEAIVFFGEPDTATYGQTFVAPQESTLTGFTVYVDPSDNPGPIDFKFYVMAWDGEKARAPILYESAATSTLGRPDMSPYHFDTGNLELTPGQQYVAFVSAAMLFDGITGMGGMGGVSPGTYDGGIFMYSHHGSDFSAVTNQAWSAHGDWDLAFTAIFGFGQFGPPVITSQPQSQSVAPGGSVTFSVTANGTTPLSYQWFKNGATIDGAIGSSHTVNNVQQSDVGEYTVQVSNPYGSVLSAAAVLTLTTISPELTITALDGGWYDVSGHHDAGNLNYYVGDGVGGAPLRNWFLFAIPPLPGPIQSAVLRLNTYFIISPDFSESYQLRQVITPASALRAGGFGLTNIYNDLGNGTIYGTRAFALTEAQQIVSMPLNAALISDVAGAAGGLFAIGGELISLDAEEGNDEAIFSGSDDADAVELVLQFEGGGTVITTTNDWNGSDTLAGFGEPDTATYGQIFVPPAAGPLTSFTFFLQPHNNPGPIDFKFYVMAWDGQKAAGPVLYESAINSTAGRPGMQAYRFDTGGVFLNPGQEYVAFVSASSLFDGIDGTGSMGALNENAYEDGDFVFLNHGDNFSALTNTTWAIYSDWDLAFVAVFGFGPPQTRSVRLGHAVASCGELTVPITLFAEGDEHALGLSVNYDPTLLSNPAVILGGDASDAIFMVNSDETLGRLGVILALPDSQTFSAGLNELLSITFSVSHVPSNTVAEIALSDEPVLREISDAAANVLIADYHWEWAAIFAGYEADVAPRPNGNNNGAVTVTDWVQVGRFAVGIDYPEIPSEFQRADCAPLLGCGDGAITMADWVQAGRFAANLDPVRPSGGPDAPIVEPFPAPPDIPMLSIRTVRIVDATMRAGAINSVAIELFSEDDENAIGFSLSFDPTVLRFEDASPAGGAVEGNLLVNAREAWAGRVALALALPTGRAFASGAQQILQARFTALPGAAGSRTAITFGRQPVMRQISDALAHPLSANYVNGGVLITTGNSALRLQAPQRLPSGAIRLFTGTQDGSPIDPARLPKIQLRASPSLAVPTANWSPLTSAPALVNGLVRFDDWPPANQLQRFYIVAESP